MKKQLALQTLVFSLVGSLSLSSCTPEAGFVAVQGNSLSQNNRPLQSTSNSFDVALAGSGNKIDVLFIVDNSGSMGDEQNILANSFSDFITEFTRRNSDFQIGVLTTDVAASNRGELRTQYPGESFLTATTPNLVSKFNDNVRVGTNGSSQEQALQSLGLFLEPNRLNGANAGFIRSDALLSVIVISDEDESESAPSGDTIDSRITRVLDRVVAVKGQANRVRFDFIIDSDATPPNPVPTGSSPVTSHSAFRDQFTPFPACYLRAAERTNSKVANLGNNRNFANDLIGIGGDLAAQGQSQFRLSNIPVAGSLQVVLGGIAVPSDSVNGYVYLSATNTIELRGAALSRAPGNRLVVQYQYYQ